MLPSDVKRKILEKIFDRYAAWTAGETFSCRKGCALCCTQHVMMSAAEGHYIYEHIRRRNMGQWLGERLAYAAGPRPPVRLTTNGFARLCLARSAADCEAEQPAMAAVCPFLAEDCCQIYEARPFACRCFASSRDCHESGTASLSEKLVLLNTVVMQVIEHAGQGDAWGNMLDVLLVQSHQQANREVGEYIRDAALHAAAQAGVVRAEPVPGFLLKPGEEHEVQQFLQALFAEKIGTATLGDILNGRARG
jgi:Fe-S-cluster containining protein